MRTAAVLFWYLGFGPLTAGATAGQTQWSSPNPGSDDTYFTIHNIRPAHAITLGAGIRVGILDRSFDLDSHPELYAGGENFLEESIESEANRETHHGYWMALTLREIAPKAEIFALGVHTRDEEVRVEAMIRALDWAVENDLDVVTYCAGGFSEAARKALDSVVERTVEAGVVVVFVDFPHPLNLLPGGFGPTGQDGGRDPDLNIFSHDCTAVIADQLVALADPDDDGIQRNRPFLAIPSAGPVTAGFVALVKSMDPNASPSDVKSILREASRPLNYQGKIAPKVPDLLRAVTNAVGVYPEARDR